MLQILKPSRIVILIITLIIVAVPSLSILYMQTAFAQSCGSIASCEAAAEQCRSNDGEWDGAARLCKGSEEVALPAQQLDDPKYVANDCNEVNLDESNCGIIRYLVIIINFLSAMVGIVVVGSIIYGGILYSSAGGDPQKVSAAKSRIQNSIIALVFFMFTYGMLNWLVPGGVL